MQAHFEAAIAFHRTKGIEIEVTLVGDRPCSGEVDAARQKALEERCAKAIKNYYGFEVVYRSGSTDCNIPLSMGVPAVCPGIVIGKGAHTREEYIEIDSLLPGLKAAAEMILYHFEEK